jgi:hypothetical protein
MEDIPNTLSVTSGDCIGIYERVDDVNSMPSWATADYTILFKNKKWMIIDNNNNSVYIEPNWPNVEVLE